MGLYIYVHIYGCTVYTTPSCDKYQYICVNVNTRACRRRPDTSPPARPSPIAEQSDAAHMSGRAVDAAGNLEGYEIFIKYLPQETTEESLREFFAPAGEIVGTPRLMTHPQTGKCKGVGWITFASKEGLSEALSWNGCPYGGRNLNVTAAKAFHTGVRPSVQAHGTHTPALLREVVAKMVGSDKSGVYVDATFGRGGHSRGILAALSPTAQLHAFDMDPEAIKAAKEMAASDSRFKIHHAPFSAMKRTLDAIGVRPSGVFFDLGISSPQFDEAHRGFRPEADGPLDLRFDQTKGETALEFLERAPRDEMVRVIAEYGETSDYAAARRIADAICIVRARGALPKRTREFASMVADAKGKEYQSMHAAKLTFQALRIHLNDEFGELRRGLAAAGELLRDGGRIGLITWKHSECAIVVDEFRKLEAARKESPLCMWYNEQQGKQRVPPPPSDGWALTMDDVTRPSGSELQANSRSRSALLHVLRKARGPRLADLEARAYPLLGWQSDKSLQGDKRSAAGVAVDPAAEKAARKARKAEKRKAAAESIALDSGEDEKASKTVAARRNREEKKALKKRQRAEREAAVAVAAGGAAGALKESDEAVHSKKRRRKDAS
jgi:16S rRNA (cytosine1402-N4)-methyltransferase